MLFGRCRLRLAPAVGQLFVPVRDRGRRLAVSRR